MRDKYIDAQTFKEFCLNQSILVDTLNHRMTAVEEHLAKIKADMGVIKNENIWQNKILWMIFAGITATLFTVIIKTWFGV